MAGRPRPSTLGPVIIAQPGPGQKQTLRGCVFSLFVSILNTDDLVLLKVQDFHANK